MEPEDHGPFVIHAAPHPSAPVERFGFPLGHPYVDQCLLPLLGPSSVTVLRRLPELWKLSHPFETTFVDFGKAMGLRARNLDRTFERLAKYGFATRPAPDQLDVYARCAPLTERMLAQVPPWLRALHDRMLDDHLAVLTRDLTGARQHASPNPAAAPDEPTAPLDRLRQKPPTRPVPMLGR